MSALLAVRIVRISWLTGSMRGCQTGRPFASARRSRTNVSKPGRLASRRTAQARASASGSAFGLAFGLGLGFGWALAMGWALAVGLGPGLAAGVIERPLDRRPHGHRARARPGGPIAAPRRLCRAPPAGQVAPTRPRPVAPPR